MRSFDCFVRFLPVSDRRELNSYKMICSTGNLKKIQGLFNLKPMDTILLPTTDTPGAQNPETVRGSHSKSKIISKKLDSLSREQERISVQLDLLKFHAEQMRKAQRRGDLINGGIIILFVFLMIKILLSRRKISRKKQPFR